MTRRRRLLTAVVILSAALAAWPARGAPTISGGTVTSFDGTKIKYTLFLPDGASASTPAPVILVTHGWGGTGATSVGGDVELLLDAGYAVLTWDQRGFGASGGEANVDSQEFEVRDVQTLIGFVASQPEIQTDGPGDPRMGMLGGSYAGGIQLMTAAADPRVDAIAPDIAWNDLPYALFPGGVNKLGWDAVLYGAGLATATAAGLPSETGAYAIEIHQAFVEGTATNQVSPELVAWFDARSPKNYINGATLPDSTVLPGISAPTLLTQGTIDTLFNLTQAIRNEAQIAANGVPTKMIFYCGGHTFNAGNACDPADQTAHIDAAVLAWFDRYVRGTVSTPTGAAIEYQTQDGIFHDVAALPATTVSASGSGSLVNTVVPTSGSALWATPSPDGFRFAVGAPAGAHLLGVPAATVSVTGVGPEASLFVKLLDVAPDGSAVVIDDQANALKVTGLSDAAQTFTFDLAGVAWAVEAGHSIAVEVSATSLDHSSTRTPFVADVEVTVAVPYRMP